MMQARVVLYCAFIMILHCFVVCLYCIEIPNLKKSTMQNKALSHVQMSDSRIFVPVIVLRLFYFIFFLFTLPEFPCVLYCPSSLILFFITSSAEMVSPVGSHSIFVCLF